MDFELVWFDSMGAKSSCTLVTTPDTGILIDPGAAIMQPSFPLHELDKWMFLEKAHEKIREAAKRADHVVISHYHYDHFTAGAGAGDLYQHKDLWIKDPNRWINISQWDRSREFLQWLTGLEGNPLRYKRPEQTVFEDPSNYLPLAVSRDFGNYQNRREELLVKWQKRFFRIREKWVKCRWVCEPSERVHFADGSAFQVGETKVRFTHPLFHGIEYSNTGWVFATVIEQDDTKLIYTSDLQGPTIEDHAEWIIHENPDILILDGPATYLLGYMLNTTNLNRSVENAVWIIENCDLDVMIYDHHLLRDPLYKERTAKLWDMAEDMGVRVTTAAEYNGNEPVVLRGSSNSEFNHER
jgi:predicted metallo-beta-lactamase superfamily hydrolase